LFLKIAGICAASVFLLVLVVVVTCLYVVKRSDRLMRAWSRALSEELQALGFTVDLRPCPYPHHRAWYICGCVYANRVHKGSVQDADAQDKRAIVAAVNQAVDHRRQNAPRFPWRMYRLEKLGGWHILFSS
jgi:hypothetical protein